jgi:hypothetical protein
MTLLGGVICLTISGGKLKSRSALGRRVSFTTCDGALLLLATGARRAISALSSLTFADFALPETPFDGAVTAEVLAVTGVGLLAAITDTAETLGANSWTTGPGLGVSGATGSLASDAALTGAAGASAGSTGAAVSDTTLGAGGGCLSASHPLISTNINIPTQRNEFINQDGKSVEGHMLARCKPCGKCANAYQAISSCRNQRCPRVHQACTAS